VAQGPPGLESAGLQETRNSVVVAYRRGPVRTEGLETAAVGRCHDLELGGGGRVVHRGPYICSIIVRINIIVAENSDPSKFIFERMHLRLRALQAGCARFRIYPKQKRTNQKRHGPANTHKISANQKRTSKNQSGAAKTEATQQKTKRSSKPLKRTSKNRSGAAKNRSEPAKTEAEQQKTEANQQKPTRSSKN